MNRAFAIAAIVLALLLSLTLVEVALANPIIDPLVIVESPQNNQIYPSNTVQLNFTAIGGFNYTAYYYVLDEQSPKTTNGISTLNDLTPGTHTLKIYGNGSWTSQPNNITHVQNDVLVDFVYFSTYFSTAWVVFSIILALVVIIALILFTKRRQIATALRREKNAFFYDGIILLLFGTIVCVLFAGQVANNYLFPHWPLKALSLNPNIPFTVSLIVMSAGLLLIWLGIRKSNSSKVNPSATTASDKTSL